MIEISIPFSIKKIPKQITEPVYTVIIKPNSSIPELNVDGYTKCTIDCRTTDFTRVNIPHFINKLKHFDIINCFVKPIDLKYIKNYKIDSVELDLTDNSFFKYFKRGYLLEMFNKNIYLEINLGLLIRQTEFINLRKLYEVIDHRKIIFSTCNCTVNIFKTDYEVEKIIGLFTNKYRNNKEVFLRAVAIRKYTKNGFTEKIENRLAEKYIFNKINEYFNYFRVAFKKINKSLLYLLLSEKIFLINRSIFS